MRYDEYAERLRSYRAPGVRLARYGEVHENGRLLPLLSLHTGGRTRLVLTAGFHGEEPSGPLTLLHRLPEVLELARSHDVGLDVFPCINPSGFEGGHRYNASGEQPNNDFLRYEVAPGEWKDQLEAGASFLRWRRYDAGPKETRALRTALAALPLPEAALDLHQDAYTEGDLTYAYVFGDDAPLPAHGGGGLEGGCRSARTPRSTDPCGPTTTGWCAITTAASPTGTGAAGCPSPPRWRRPPTRPRRSPKR